MIAISGKGFTNTGTYPGMTKGPSKNRRALPDRLFVRNVKGINAGPKPAVDDFY